MKLTWEFQDEYPGPSLTQNTLALSDVSISNTSVPRCSVLQRVLLSWVGEAVCLQNTGLVVEVWGYSVCLPVAQGSQDLYSHVVSVKDGLG